MIFIVLSMKEACGLWMPLQSQPLTDFIHLGVRILSPTCLWGLFSSPPEGSAGSACW